MLTRVIKYHFFSLRYDSTWDWTPVFWTGICIYIERVWSLWKLFLILKGSSLMKQVKSLNGLISYTNYKSFWATLDTNQIKKNTRKFSILYSWSHCSLTYSLSHIDPPILVQDFELWFVRPEDFIPLLYCPVFMYLGLLGPFDIVLLPQQRFLDSNSAL